MCLRGVKTGMYGKNACHIIDPCSMFAYSKFTAQLIDFLFMPWVSPPHKGQSNNESYVCLAATEAQTYCTVHTRDSLSIVFASILRVNISSLGSKAMRRDTDKGFNRVCLFLPALILCHFHFRGIRFCCSSFLRSLSFCSLCICSFCCVSLYRLPSTFDAVLKLNASGDRQ